MDNEEREDGGGRPGTDCCELVPPPEDEPQASWRESLERLFEAMHQR